MARIMLTRNYYALVDDELFEELSKYSWYASGKEPNVYAARRMRDDEIYPRSLIYMHHQVLGVHPKDLIDEEVDHKNRIKLDNRKSNLVLKTHAENCQNSDLTKRQIGISIDRAHGTYKAYVNHPTKNGTIRVNIGTFKTFDEAYEARQQYLKKGD